VTKTVPLNRILPFLQAGIQHVGENRVQEALTKSSELRAQNSEIKLHLIGPLQSNKARKAVENFDVIQTLDRWELAEDLNRHAAALGKAQDCLVQVKISDEPSKSGIDPAALPEFLDKLTSLPHLRVRGLMGIPPLAAAGDAARPSFQRLKRLFDETAKSVSGFRFQVPDTATLETRNLKLALPFDVLSMGMSSDFEAAIEEGSTMVRIGSALFGPRQ
jgi:pyridoxal phosphate enzyme (YggS family)